MKIIKEFREFAIKGNMRDMAVGIIIGVAFNRIVNSLVQDIFMPVIENDTTVPTPKNLELLSEIRDLLKKGRSDA